MGDKRKSIESVTDWLGLSEVPNWRAARFLGPVFSMVIVLLFVLAIIAAFAVLFQLVFGGGEVTFGAGALITALLGAPFLIWGTVLKHQTVMFQKEGHMTDRINKAVEQLGAEKEVSRVMRNASFTKGGERNSFLESRNDPKEFPEDAEKKIRGDWLVVKRSTPNIEVRIGAILSLERIAQDSTRHDKGRDHVRVMEILCAYTRENTQIPRIETEADEEGPFTPRTDIQIVLDVIKRRSQEQIAIEANQRYRLDLRRCDLRGVDLSRGSFRGAIFSECRFEFSTMQASDFTGARFDGSVLNYLDCMKAKFIGASMNCCRIDKPEPIAGGFVKSINMGNLMGLSLISANIPSLQYFDDKGSTFGTKDTILNFELNMKREKGVKIAHDLVYKENRMHSDEVAKLREQLSGNPFVHWSPYDGSDMATGHLLKEFRVSLSLTGWPYED